MTYDHQPFVSRLVWKSFGALAKIDPEGRDRNGLINDVLENWLRNMHPGVIKHYCDMENTEKEFLDGLKKGTA